MYSVYVLRSLKDQRLYIGQTQDLGERIVRHNAGRVRSTKNRTPFVLIYQETVPTRSEAMKRETYFKSLKGSVRFKKIIGLV